MGHTKRGAEESRQEVKGSDGVYRRVEERGGDGAYTETSLRKCRGSERKEGDEA